MEELWDDSVLIKAFNNAIAKYKDMHGNRTMEAENTQEITGHALADVDSKNTFGIEATDRFESEKGASISVESPHGVSKEDTVVSPVHGDGFPSTPYVGAAEHIVDWVEYERQQITQQLAQLADQREKLEERLTKLDSMELANTATPAIGYSGVDYYSQYTYPSTADNCYYCQWNAYYNSVGSQTPSADFLSNGLHCQHCGFVNKYEESIPKAAQTSSQLYPNESTLSEIARKAVSEAIKMADIKVSENRTSFSDVAVAWFLAGFQTSRYLVQENDCKPGPGHEDV